MSGNDRSNEDLVMGRTNRAQDRTKLIAEPDENGGWNGVDNGSPGAVLYLEAHKDLQETAGVVAHGGNRGVGVTGRAGTGVRGIGEPNAGSEGLTLQILPSSLRGEEGRGIGVRASGSAPGEGIGVFSSGRWGVVGVGGAGEPGVVASTDRGPQLRLEPHRIDEQGDEPALPEWGAAGDVIFILSRFESVAIPQGPSLWICVDDEVAGVAAARWARIGLGTPVTGTMRR